MFPRSGSARGESLEEDTGDSKASSAAYKVIFSIISEMHTFSKNPFISEYCMFASDWLGWGKIIRPWGLFC